MSTFPPPAYLRFQEQLALFGDAVKNLVQELDTWAGNKLDSNPNFDFTTATADLATARANFETNISTIMAL